MTVMEFGDIRLSRILESEEFILTPEEVFPDYDPAVFARHMDWLAPRHYRPDINMLVITNQSYLLQTPDRIILVDGAGGNGKDRNRPFFHHRDWPWLANLAAAGVAPGDIDTVVCTHMHVDHVGWYTQLVDGEWVPSCANATYLFVREEWEHWDPLARETGLPRTGDYIADSVRPVVDAGQARFVERDHEIAPGIRLEHLPGHTPGQCGVRLSGGGRDAILCGDALHHAIQFVETGWSTKFDSDQDTARATREAFLARYADTGTVVFTAHLPSPTGVTVHREGAAFGFSFIGETGD